MTETGKENQGCSPHAGARLGAVVRCHKALYTSREKAQVALDVMERKPGHGSLSLSDLSR